MGQAAQAVLARDLVVQEDQADQAASQAWDPVAVLLELVNLLPALRALLPPILKARVLVPGHEHNATASPPRH